MARKLSSKHVTKPKFLLPNLKPQAVSLSQALSFADAGALGFKRFWSWVPFSCSLPATWTRGRGGGFRVYGLEGVLLCMAKCIYERTLALGKASRVQSWP